MSFLRVVPLSFRTRIGFGKLRARIRVFQSKPALSSSSCKLLFNGFPLMEIGIGLIRGKLIKGTCNITWTPTIFFSCRG